MTATVIDGKALATKVRAEVAGDVAELGDVGIATVLVGDDPASHSYVRMKVNRAVSVGMEPRLHNHYRGQLSGDDSHGDVVPLVTRLRPGAHRFDTMMIVAVAVISWASAASTARASVPRAAVSRTGTSTSEPGPGIGSLRKNSSARWRVRTWPLA